MTIRVGIEGAAQGQCAYTFHVWLSGHFPIVVDVVANDVLHVGRQFEIRVRQAVGQILVVDMVNGQRAQGDANRRAVALFELLNNGQAGGRVQAQPRRFNNLRVVSAFPGPMPAARTMLT